MEMQQVRYFLAVAKTLNFTRAAEESNVTQPALTRAIKQLEDELGGELIRREGRHSHLTDLGNRMQPLLKQCYESALTAKALAAKVKKGDVSTLSIAVSQTLDLDLLMGPLEGAFDVLQDGNARFGPVFGCKSRRQAVEELHGVEICGQGGKIEL